MVKILDYEFYLPKNSHLNVKINILVSSKILFVIVQYLIDWRVRDNNKFTPTFPLFEHARLISYTYLSGGTYD